MPFPVILLTSLFYLVHTQHDRYSLVKRSTNYGLDWDHNLYCYSCDFDPDQHDDQGNMLHNCPTLPIHAPALVGVTRCSGQKKFCGYKQFHDMDHAKGQLTLWLGCVDYDWFDDCKDHMGSGRYPGDVNENCRVCSNDLCNGRNDNIIHYKVDDLQRNQPHAVAPGFDVNHNPDYVPMGPSVYPHDNVPPIPPPAPEAPSDPFMGPPPPPPQDEPIPIPQDDPLPPPPPFEEPMPDPAPEPEPFPSDYQPQPEEPPAQPEYQ
ncbi:nematocyst expressed protein 4-like [Paramacrobiotus metropolitanus]|uniref:nematocyst expressed protein 4-like n=1 Tax=Paramacrobiotus metropolitanus TaxID=2943436 RepID=UPI00244581B4|nr:nematocyst expressed protein 4-like [Paramacrobiotus metropolitanus]